MVALASPKDLSALDDLRFACGCEIQTVLALEDEIVRAIDRYYRDEWVPGAPEEAPARSRSSRSRPSGSQRDEAAERSAVSMLERVIGRAAKEGASDIHFEPRQDDFRIRFRVDGTFRDVALLPMELAPALVARVKVLAGMDIAEHRLPQDGRFSASVEDRRLDLRSSTYPTVHGEKAVLRLLDNSGLRRRLDGIGMRGARPRHDARADSPAGRHRPHHRARPAAARPPRCTPRSRSWSRPARTSSPSRIPVEYALPGVNQGQTNEKAGFTFAKGLRAVLRQDPDVIMVGEIRDGETLGTAIEASLTGHLVLSTLHTNSAIATIARLVEMDLEPYLLASSVLGIVAQRLVRRICVTCRTEVQTAPALRAMFRAGGPQSFFRGMGCRDCRGTGFRGRIGIFEMLRMTPEINTLVLERAPDAKLFEAAAEAA